MVDLLDIDAFRDYEWGYTGIFARMNGGSSLVDAFPDPRKAIWEFEGIYARSRHLRGVRFPGIVHPGQIGTAPDEALLRRWNEREAALIETQPDRVPPLGQPPNPENAVVGALTGADADRVANEAAASDDCGSLAMPS